MSKKALVLEALWVLLLTGLGLWLRWPALGAEGFHNEDAAGITYNADLLRHGLLPMVDDLELKAPGSFFVSWIAWGLFGRTIGVLQATVCAWALLGGLGVYLAGRMLYGARAAAVAALLYTVFAPISDSIDINYGAWMVPASIWATVFFVAGLKRGRVGWLVATGAMLAVAGLLKRQAAVLTPLFYLVAVLPRLERPEGWAPALPWRPTLLAFGAGLSLGFAPILLFYLAHGELVPFVEHYFFSKGGWRYVAGEVDTWGKVLRLGDGFLGFFEYMATATVLSIMTLAAAVWPKQRWTVPGVLLAGHFWLSFAGAALGFRFFKGYYLQILPAAAWIAAHPNGPITRWLDRDAWHRPLRSLAVVALLGAALAPAVIQDVGELRSIRKQRAHPRDQLPQKIARVVRENTDPGDRIWVWGRWAWPVYFHADRLSASRVYKQLGILTTNLTNTWRRATERTRFVEDSPWQPVIAELEWYEPAFVVLSHNEDYSKFTALKRLTRDRYRRVPNLSVRGFSVYHRKDLKLRAPPAAKKKPRPKRRKPKKAKPRQMKAPAAHKGPKVPVPAP